MRLPGLSQWTDANLWLSREPHAGAPLGVRFLTAKNMLGMQPPERGRSESWAESVVRKFLVALYTEVEARTGAAPTQIAISVPALYSSSRRTALTATARAAGFPVVHLLNDSMAAAIAHMSHTLESRAVVTYTIGYAGFETALIRFAKGRFRAVCCDGGDCPGGASFDDMILRGLAREHPVLRHWPTHVAADADYSMAWRALAQQFKEALCKTGEARLRLGRAGWVHVSRRSFHRAIEDTISGTMESAMRAIRESNLEQADIDDVLLVGGSAGIEPVRLQAEKWFARPAILVDEFSLAEGAALYADRVDAPSAVETGGGRGIATTENALASPMQIEITPGSELAADLDPVSGSAASFVPAEFDAPAATDALSGVLDGRQLVLDHARSLIVAGERDAASAFLRELLGELQTLVNSLGAPQRVRMKKESEWLLARARDLLKAGRRETAIEHAHRAYAVDRETPLVFGEMIEVHCEAAAAETDFTSAMRWLTCAQSHDRTNSRVHAVIADHLYRHARDLSDRECRDEAIAALEECLCFEPEHGPAQALRAVLSGAQHRVGHPAARKEDREA